MYMSRTGARRKAQPHVSVYASRRSRRAASIASRRIASRTGPANRNNFNESGRVIFKIIQIVSLHSILNHCNESVRVNRIPLTANDRVRNRSGLASDHAWPTHSPFTRAVKSHVPGRSCSHQRRDGRTQPTKYDLLHYDVRIDDFDVGLERRSQNNYSHRPP